MDSGAEAKAGAGAGLPALGSEACRRLDDRVDASVKLTMGSVTMLLSPLNDHPLLVLALGAAVVLVAALQWRSRRLASPVELSAKVLVATTSANGILLVVDRPAYTAAVAPLLFVVLAVHLGLLRSRREAVLQVLWATAGLGVTLGMTAEPRYAIGVSVITLTVLLLLTLATGRVRARMDELVGELTRRAERDSLTGLLNRDGMVSRWRSQPQGRGEMTAVLLDIDHFKRINDAQGHAGGDAALVWVGATLQAGVRSPDLVARHGGEEFLVLLNGGSRLGAEVAERLRAAMETGSRSTPHPLTISAGVATAPRGDDLTEVCSRADVGLYRAKASGRNRVEAGPRAGEDLPGRTGLRLPAA